jgi:hypothetical protein
MCGGVQRVEQVIIGCETTSAQRLVDPWMLLVCAGSLIGRPSP